MVQLWGRVNKGGVHQLYLKWRWRLRDRPEEWDCGLLMGRGPWGIWHSEASAALFFFPFQKSLAKWPERTRNCQICCVFAFQKISRSKPFWEIAMSLPVDPIFKTLSACCCFSQKKKNVVPNKFFCSWRSFPAEQYKQDIHYLVHCRITGTGISSSVCLP